MIKDEKKVGCHKELLPELTLCSSLVLSIGSSVDGGHPGLFDTERGRGLCVRPGMTLERGFTEAGKIVAGHQATTPFNNHPGRKPWQKKVSKHHFSTPRLLQIDMILKGVVAVILDILETEVILLLYTWTWSCRWHDHWPAEWESPDYDYDHWSWPWPWPRPYSWWGYQIVLRGLFR